MIVNGEGWSGVAGSSTGVEERFQRVRAERVEKGRQAEKGKYAHPASRRK